VARPREDERFSARLVAVAVLGFVLLVPPIVTVFDGGGEVFGVPLIWAYLFVVWALIIGSVALLVSRSG
jgi:hypothetical protein